VNAAAINKSPQIFFHSLRTIVPCIRLSLLHPPCTAFHFAPRWKWFGSQTWGFCRGYPVPVPIPENPAPIPRYLPFPFRRLLDGKKQKTTKNYTDSVRCNFP